MGVRPQPRALHRNVCIVVSFLIAILSAIVVWRYGRANESAFLHDDPPIYHNDVSFYLSSTSAPPPSSPSSVPPPSPTPAPPSSQSPLSTPAFLWTPAEAERRNPSSRSCAYLGDCPQWPHRLSRLSDGWVRPEPGHVTLAVHGSLVEAGAAPQDVAPGLYKCARALCRVVDVSRGSPDPPPNASLVGSDTLTWERGGAWHGAIDAFLFVTTRAEARTHTGRQPQFVAHWDPIAAADLRPPSDKALVNNERSWYGTPQWRIHWEGELGHLPPPPEGVEFAREIPSSTNPYSEAALRLRGTPWEARSRDDLLAIVHSADTCSAALALAAKSGVRVVVAGAVKCGPWSPRAGAAKAALQGDQSVAAAAAPACDALPRTWNSTGPTPAFAWGGEVRVLTECLMHAHRYCLIIDPPSSAPGYASPLLWAALRSGCVPAYVERNGTLREPDLRALLPVPDAGVFVTANDSSAALRLLATELGDRTAYAKRMAWKEQPAGEWQGGFRAALTRSVATAYCDVCDTVETTPNLRAVATPRDGESIWLQPCVRTFFDEAVFRVDRAKSQSGWAAAAGIDRTYVTHYSRSNARRGRTTERLASVGLEADWILGGDSDDFRHNASLFRCLFHGSHADAIEFSRNIFSILPVATSLVIKHIFAAYDMVKRNYSAVLVLEDDVLPSANFTTDLAVAVASLNAEAPNWDMVMVGTCLDIHADTKNFRRVGGNLYYKGNYWGSRCTHAYLLSRSGAFKMIRSLPVYHAIDFEVNLNNIESWWMEPPGALQDAALPKCQ